mmetsp:Transcript_33441/g.84242  ORF Transcript_33441/g.84242 Transcript_33441/m.84242 type:complete len:204 (-) Transcript_33441:102-713(-)
MDQMSAAGVSGWCASISGARPASTMSIPYFRKVLMVYLSPLPTRSCTPSPTSAIFTVPVESTSRFSGLRSLCVMQPEGLLGSCSHAMPAATERRMSMRRSTVMLAPCRVTCSRRLSVQSSRAIKTCELVIPQQWKKGTRGDWFSAVSSSTSRSTSLSSSRPSSPGGREMRFTATAWRIRVVCWTYPRKTYVPLEPTPMTSSSL